MRAELILALVGGWRRKFIEKQKFLGHYVHTTPSIPNKPNKVKGL